MIEAVKEIKEKKEHAAVQKQEASRKRNRIPSVQGRLCLQRRKVCCFRLEEYQTCFQGMKSVCSKIKCRVDGGKPKMIIPSAQIKEKQPSRILFPVTTDESGSESEVDSAEDSDQEMVEEK